VATKLDAIDYKIVKEVMADGRVSNKALAAKVGISPPPSLRRLRALEDAGIIQGYHADVDLPTIGFTVTAFVSVALHNQADKDLRAFENLVLGWPIVREAHMMSGETDYLLKCVASDLTTFQAFLRDTISPAPNVASVKVQVAMRRAKFAAGADV